MKRLYFIAFLVLVFSGTSAQSGSLDHSFSHDGIKKFDLRINALTEEGKTVLNLPDGKKIIVFTSNGYTKLTRLHSNGKTDLSFGEDGFSVAVNIEAVNAVLSKHGKIVVAGASDNASGIARFNANGSLDRTFHHNGLLAGIDFQITDLADYFDGKIVVIGEKNNEYGVIVARYLANGSADPSFDGDGRTIFNVNNNSSFAGPHIAVLPNGKILTGFTPENFSGPSGFHLIRLNANGSIDEDFGTGGEVINVFGNSWLKSLLVQPDGKILASGYYSYPSDLLMVRYNYNGTVDSRFGMNGIVTVDLNNGGTIVNSIALKPDRKIVAAGDAYYYVDPLNNGYVFSAMQFNPNGSLDSSFGNLGTGYIDVGGDVEYVSGISIEPAGNILLCGTQLGIKNEIQYQDFVVCRLSANGVPDPKFANKGILIGGCPSNSTSFTHAAVQPGGKLIVAGELSNEMDTAFLMMRLNYDGSPDQSFGNNGIVIGVANVVEENINHSPNTLQLQTDGKIIVSGVDHRFPGRTYRYNSVALKRYSIDGHADHESFASRSLITYPNWHIFSTWVLNDGSTVSAAYLDTIGRRDFSITKLPPPPYGYPIIFFTFLGSVDYITTMAVQPDDKILVAGRRNVDNKGTEFSITRLNADGSLDLDFGNGGKQIAGFEKNDDGIVSMVIQPDGKIVAAGYSRHPKTGKSNFAVIRLNANGSLDEAFGMKGKQQVDFNGGEASVTSIALEPGGKIILGGVLENDTKGNHHHHNFKSSVFAIARLEPDGHIDHEFGKKGRVVTNTSYKPDSLSSVVVSGNRLYAAGVNEDKFDLNSNQGIVAAYRLYCDDMQNTIEPNLTAASTKTSEETNKRLSIQASPNPGINYFVITIKSLSDRPVSYRVTDAVGRLIEQKTGISANQSFQIGTGYQTGIYFIQVTQDGLTKQLKLVKLGN